MEKIEYLPTSRIDGIDLAKGIGILLVYIGHVPPTSGIHNFIYAFHMPLFFYLSGIFLNEQKRNPLDFFLNKTKTLLIPLLTFVCFSIIVGWICDGNFKRMHLGINGALWFLPVLYLSEIFSYAICRFYKTFHGRLYCCFFLTIVALIIDYFSIKVPFALHSVPLASTFLLLGRISSVKVRSFFSEDNITRTRICYISILSIIFITTFVIWCPQCTNMHNAHLAYGPIGGGIAILGIILTISMSKFFDGMSHIKAILVNLGKNSITIFGLHLTIIEAFGLSGRMFNDSMYTYFTLNFLVVCILFFLIKVINRWSPYLIGKF